MTSLNENCAGAWSSADGLPVTHLETAANGRSVRVLLPETDPRYSRRGHWLPAAWVTIDERKEMDR